MDQNKDFYKVLGVSEKASIAEIKSAYRKLAKKHHPDMNPTNKKAAEDMFKKISEAYYVLGDEKRKQEYDSFRLGGYSQPHAGGQQQYYSGAQGFDIDDLLAHLGFAGRGRRTTARESGMNYDVFDDIFGGSFSPGERKSFTKSYGRQAAETVNTDLNAQIEIPHSLALSGGKIDLNLSNRKNITVSIPKGVSNGAKLRLSGLGEICPCCSHHGDLLLKIKIK